jgi:hypothetical protein
MLLNRFSVSKPVLKQGIPKEYDIAGTCAQNCLKRMCDNLQSGEINIEDVRKVSQHLGQMKLLCSAISNKSYLYTSVQRAIKERCEEHTKVKRHRKLISHLFHHLISCDKVQGMSSTKKLLY